MQSTSHRLGPLARNASARGTQSAPVLSLLEQQLKKDFLREAESILPESRIELVLREAAAQADATAFPCLWFPELAREKFLEARAWARRQQAIRVRSFVSFSA